jgi:cell division septum initiation protein DivIVA
MAIEEPEVDPTKVTDSEQLESEGFNRVRRGFAPDQVAEYLKRVAASVLMMESRLEETRNELLETRRDRDAALAELESARHQPYDDVSDRVTELVRAFDAQVGDLQRSAQAEADRVLLDARMEADRIVGGARVEAERISSEAREEADRARARAELDEAESRILADRIVSEAKAEASRAESDVAAMRDKALETFRDIHSRTVAALGELEAVIERGAMPELVVIVDDADEADQYSVPEMPGPDL